MCAGSRALLLARHQHCCSHRMAPCALSLRHWHVYVFQMYCGIFPAKRMAFCRGNGSSHKGRFSQYDCTSVDRSSHSWMWLPDVCTRTATARPYGHMPLCLSWCDTVALKSAVCNAWRVMSADLPDFLHPCAIGAQHHAHCDVSLLRADQQPRRGSGLKQDSCML